MVTADFGTRKRFARSAASAALASPSAGSARTRDQRHRTAVGEHADAVDRIASRPRRQPHGKEHAARLAPVAGAGGPTPAQTKARAMLGRITLWMKMMIRIRITGEMSMPPRLGRRLRIGRSTGSVTA